MALLDFLFEGKAPPAVDTAQQSNTQLPPFAQQYMQGLMGRANAIAGQEYASFPGPRVAGANPNQTSAWNKIATNTGNTAPMFQQGSNMVQSSGTPFDQTTFNQFKSPYINDVVNRIGTLGARNFNENLLPGVNDKFIGAGQFRSDRNAEMVSRLTRDTNESIMGQQSLALQQAQDSAMGNYNNAMNRQQNAGTAMGSLAQAQSGVQIRDAAALEAAGQASRGINQQNLDIGYQNFVDQRDWGKTQSRFMNEAIRGLQPVGTVSSGTAQQLAPVMSASPLAQIAGGVGAIAALQDGGGRRYGGGGRITAKTSPLQRMRRYG